MGPQQLDVTGKSLTNTSVELNSGSNQRELGLKYLDPSPVQRRFKFPSLPVGFRITSDDPNASAASVYLPALSLSEFSLLFSAASARVESNEIMDSRHGEKRGQNFESARNLDENPTGDLKTSNLFKEVREVMRWVCTGREERKGREGGEEERRWRLRWTRRPDAGQRSAQAGLSCANWAGAQGSCVRGTRLNADADAHSVHGVDGGPGLDAHARTRHVHASSARVWCTKLDSMAPPRVRGARVPPVLDLTRRWVRRGTMERVERDEGDGDEVWEMGWDWMRTPTHMLVRTAECESALDLDDVCARGVSVRERAEGRGRGWGDGRDEDGCGDSTRTAQDATHSREPDWTERVCGVRVGTAAYARAGNQGKGG
ncbi:hypothetical protein B0H16DRAFT_1480335 [Mycena metata]|uniref:Uncharacterized protein n=1 Tax=Mycena metata TaxID=1033252 RepID=A0AAD7H3J1_9AGAR|nr:hypothetical protein B0H16DRAFT_1480335 [Mycena metata]